MNIRTFLWLILISCGLATPVYAADEEDAGPTKEGEEKEEEKEPDTGGKKSNMRHKCA